LKDDSSFEQEFLSKGIIWKEKEIRIEFFIKVFGSWITVAI